jgi:hypothetical protein
LNESMAALGPILLARQAVVGGQHMIGAQAQIDGAHLFKAAQQETGSRQQHQGYGEFGDHQEGTQARVAAAGLPVRRPSFSVSFTLVCAAASAGMIPHRKAVTTTSPNAKVTTCQSRLMELTRGRVSGES